MSQTTVVVPPASTETIVTPVAAPPVVTTPAATVAPVVVTPVQPATPAAPALAADDGQTDPNWFKPRLQRERAKALKDAGFDSEADAKAAAKAIHDQREAEKATTAKLAERDSELTRVKTRAEQLEASTREYAARMMVGLTEAQKAAIVAIAGEDSAAQINAITKLTPTWAKEVAAAPAAAAPATVVVPATATAPAVVVTTSAPAGNTAPGRTAPSGGDTSPVDHKSVYTTLAEKNPFAAAKYGIEHADTVFKSEP